MKRIICFIIIIALLLSSSATAYAKNDNSKDKGHHYDSHENNKPKETKKEFKIHDTPVIKYGRYKLPIAPVEVGMGATVCFDKATAILTVTKNTTTIVINFKNRTVYVNGVQDKKSGIFSASNSKKMIVLIKYIAKILGITAYEYDDEIIIITPEQPDQNCQINNITLTPVGTVAVANTLNTTTTHLTASANITAGPAAGGRAELYVASKLAAYDFSITAADNTVTFSTSDGTPTNDELKALIPSGGQVSVKLYNASGNCIANSTVNPVLTVDYNAPTITSVISAVYKAAENQLILNVTGAGAVCDQLDVTKLSLTDYVLGRTWQLTNASGTGSTGSVTNASTLTVNLGSTDRIGLSGFGSSSTYLNIAAGSLLRDAAGNTSIAFAAPFLVPVSTASVTPGLSAPTNITIAAVGTTEVANTINCTTLYLSATAQIVPGQATGGKAELYVGSRLVAIDNMISVADNIVSFTTSDGSPTNAELQSLIPSGGVVTVKLYNSLNNSVISNTCNPTLKVDYAAPTITGISSALYNTDNKQLSIIVSGASAVGDMVDVTKLSIISGSSSYTLTNTSVTGSCGTVQGSGLLVVTLGIVDSTVVTSLGSSNLYLSVAAGSLLKDAAGNVSAGFTNTQYVTLTVSGSYTTLNAPTNVTVIPSGYSYVANSLNSYSTSLEASAKITPNQAAGGKAELYVGSKLAAADYFISAADTEVNFTTSDGTPTNAELQSMVPTGGVVTVKLYNSTGNSVTSSVGNPTLIVDYAAPTLTGITSAVLDMINGKIYMNVNGAGAVGDKVDVNKIALFDAAASRTYQLTGTSGTTGTVAGPNLLIISLSTADKSGLTGFGGSTVNMTVYSGYFISDAAGNTTPFNGSNITVPVSVIK